MSKAFDNFEFEPDLPAPFWKPFLLAFLFAIPASSLWFYATVCHGVRTAVLSLAIGALCGLGARRGEGDYFSAFLAAVIHTFGTILIITLVVSTYAFKLSLGENLFQIVASGRINLFFNDCLSLVGEKSFYSIPTGFYIAYKVQSRA